MTYLLASNDVPVEQLDHRTISRSEGWCADVADLVNMLSWWQWADPGAVPPAIVLLYFLKLKRRPLEVPSTYLWHKSIEDLHVNTHLAAAAAQPAAVPAIAAGRCWSMLALLRPGWQASKLTGNRFIFLVDNSASMQATDVEPIAAGRGQTPGRAS